MTVVLAPIRSMIQWFSVGLAIFGLTSALSADAADSSDSAAKAKSLLLFDGKTLQGWEGDQKVFRIDEDAIVGGSLKSALVRNEFLASTKEYGDFELRLKVKLVGSRRIPNNHEMIGYQADMGQQYWGSLYDESRRNKTLAEPDAGELKKVLKLNDWNDYVIRCEGRHIQLWLNGFKSVDYTEPDEKIEQKGLIGLQIHGGPASEAWYKDIVISEL
jgi:hypothetical protein